MTSPYKTGTVTEFPLSGNNTLDAFVNWGFKWGAGGVGVGATVTYSFPQAGAEWIGDYYDGEPFDGFQAFNASQQQATRDALSLWQEVANITFVEVTETPTVGPVEGDVGDIRFGFSAVVTNDPYAAAWGYFPFSDPNYEFPEAGDIWFDPTYGPNLQMQPGQFGFSTLIHEIGHAIGLDHPFDDGDGEPVLPASMDNNQYTIMAYDLHPTASVEAMSPMLLDILAIQYLYGANTNTRSGNDTYKFSNSTEELRAIWDAGGIDTFDCSNQTLAVKIDLNDGAFSSIGRRNIGGAATNNIAIAYNAMIENAIGGSGNDQIIGNELANVIDGGAGNDRMYGGAGNDTYYVNSTGDVIDEQGNSDVADEIRTTLSINMAVLGAGLIENARAWTNAAINISGNAKNNYILGSVAKNTLDGAAGDDILWGNDGDDLIIGGTGNDYLDGGNGNDILRGGKGNDVYLIESLSDVIDEQGNTDTGDDVRGYLSFNLNTLGGGAVDRAILFGSADLYAIGNARANRLAGNSGANLLDGGGGDDLLLGGDGDDTLIGGGGNDWLSGAGGNDMFKGGSGNDTYVVDSPDEVVDEESNKDTGDQVRATFTVDLETYAGGQIEIAVINGGDALHAYGSAGANLLWGNDAANILEGRGGDDTLIGNGGDDILIGAQGNDWIDGGNGSDSLKGDEGNDTILGGAGHDFLQGGPGQDKLRGGSGNDTYLLEDLLDTVSEEGNKDTGDEIVAAFSITLAAYDGGSVENVTLLGGADLNATGTSAGNTLIGNAGINTLEGGAGDDYLDGAAGDDILRGGSGNDIYILDSLADTIDEQGNTDNSDEVRTAAASVVLANLGGGAVEHATLLGNAAFNLTGTNASNKLTGNTASNTLDGGGGNDVLDGGLGDDTLIGGAGNDVYIIDSVGDVIDEQGADSGDEVQTAFVSIDLTTLASGKIENATLFGTAALDLTGNSAANVLAGNSGKNLLDGAGGADTLRGGAGNDIYIVDSVLDVIDEQGNTDTGDEVRSSSITLNLSSLGGAAIENATLLGSKFIGLTGNTLNNILTGNSGNNDIFGLEGNDVIIAGDGDDHLNGGTGDDVMKGGAGNDTYIVDSLQDTVDEEGNVDSADFVRTYVDVDLSVLAGGAIENATAQTGAISLKGNNGDNVLTGNVYVNVLDGGEGDDTLIGNGGADKFFGGDGSDVIAVSNTTDISIATIDGGGDTDTLEYTGNLDLTKVAQDAIQGIEVIDFSGGTASTFTAYAQDVADLSSTSTKLFVLGDADDSISFKDVATLSGLASIGGVDYRIFSYGSSSVYVEDGIAVSSAVAAQVTLGQLPGFQIAGPSTFKSGYSLRFGTHVEGIGDFNNDGFEDVLISSGRDAAYLLYGQADAYPLTFSADSSIGTDTAQLAGPSGSWVGVSLSGLGDFDGDGNVDLAVGASRDDLNGADSGGAYVVYGGEPGVLGQESLPSMAATDGSIVSGPGAGALAGSYLSVQGGGDFNGDGYDELVIATPDVASTADHAAYVIFGAPNTPASFTLPALGAGGGFTFTAAPASMIGATVASAGDINGDGYDDVVIGNNSNAAHVVFGGPSAPASITAGSLNGNNGFNISGVRSVLSSGGDFNGDGYDDLVVGDEFAGMAYVVFGKSSGFSASLELNSLDGINGFAIQANGIGGATGGCLTGDYNADGFDDLLIGVVPGIGASSAWLIYGHAGVADALVTANDLDGINGFGILGLTSGDRTGDGVAAADINGDGFDDILVGASYGDGDAKDSGTLDVIYGADFRNSGVLTGFSGADALIGSSGANQISAGQGNDIINGGGGADAINGGQGNDEIHVADNKFFRIDGGTGVDTLHLDYSGAIDFGNLDGNASTSDRNRIENVEVIDVANGHANALTLHLADVLDIDATISDVGGIASLDNALRIDGESGDTLQLFSADGWSAADTVTLAGYAIYTYQAIKVAVDTDINVTVS